MAVNKFSDVYISRYTEYLTDVIKFYNEHKHLDNFSEIARKHKISHLKRDFFYENDLHKWGNKPLTRDKVIEVIRYVDKMNPKKNKDRDTCKFKDGDVVVWDCPNCPRQYAFIGINDYGKYWGQPYSVLMADARSEDLPSHASCLTNQLHSDVEYVVETKNYTVTPKLNDYKAMVDILCREIQRMQMALDEVTMFK